MLVHKALGWQSFASSFAHSSESKKKILESIHICSAELVACLGQCRFKLCRGGNWSFRYELRQWISIPSSVVCAWTIKTCRMNIPRSLCQGRETIYTSIESTCIETTWSLLLKRVCISKRPVSVGIVRGNLFKSRDRDLGTLISLVALLARTCGTKWFYWSGPILSSFTSISSCETKPSESLRCTRVIPIQYLPSPSYPLTQRHT